MQYKNIEFEKLLIDIRAATEFTCNLGQLKILQKILFI